MASFEFEYDTLTIYKRGQKEINFILAYVFQNKGILESGDSSLGRKIPHVVQNLQRLQVSEQVAKLSKVRKLNVEKERVYMLLKRREKK